MLRCQIPHEFAHYSDGGGVLQMTRLTFLVQRNLFFGVATPASFYGPQGDNSPMGM